MSQKTSLWFSIELKFISLGAEVRIYLMSLHNQEVALTIIFFPLFFWFCYHWFHHVLSWWFTWEWTAKARKFQGLVTQEWYPLKATEGVALLEGGSGSLRGGLWGFQSTVQAQSLSLFLLSADPDVSLSSISPAPCLPVCHQALCPDDNGLDLWNCTRAPIKFFPL